jgi:transcriptional antiterminator NusG
MGEANWYVIHTYSGYENKVKTSIEKTVENRRMQDRILKVDVPEYEALEEDKNGVKKKVSRNLLPGYVLVNMIMDDDTWYIVRNTRGVTGFVGPGSEPVPLTAAEMAKIGMSTEEKKSEPVAINFAVGDLITVTTEPWEGLQTVIKDINIHKQTVTILIDLFGGQTISTEIAFSGIKLVK